jgi:hypothetical protein
VPGETSRSTTARSSGTAGEGRSRYADGFRSADPAPSSGRSENEGTTPTSGAITYRVVEHDGGWAYKVNDVFSETVPSHDAALEAAENAARVHHMADEPAPIEYQDADGQWRQEMSSGRDRPRTQVEDSPAA